MPLQRVVERDALADQPLAVIDQQPQIELRARPAAPPAASSRPSRSAARATAIASMLSDLPRSRRRAASRPSACVGTRTTRSPRAIRNRSNEPETCRQSSSAHTRSPPRPRAQTQQRGEARGADLRPSSRRAARRSPRRPRRSCASACGCPHRARSLTSSTSSSRLKWTPGGHGLLGALPRSYQVTPDIPDRRRATQQKEVRPTGPTASKRVSSPPVGTFSSASDVTDDAESQQQASKRHSRNGDGHPTQPAMTRLQ